MPTVRDVMRQDVEALAVTETVADAARYLADHDADSVVVCTADGSLTGSVSVRDIVTLVVAKGLDPQQVPLGELAGSCPALAVDVGAHVDEAVSLMSRHRLGCLPVVDGVRVVGNVTRGDAARSVALRPWTDT